MAIPSEDRQNLFPLDDKKNLFPLEDQQNLFPLEDKKNLFPLEDRQNLFPSEDQRNLFPLEDQQNLFPLEDKKNLFPLEDQRNLFPSENQQNLFPLEDQQNIFPSEDQQNLFPSENQQNIFRSEDFSDRFIKLNLSGTKFIVLVETLTKFPETRLGRLVLNYSSAASFCDVYDSTNDEFFFDRSPNRFDTILEFYRTGALHIPDGTCPMGFIRELKFWEIEEIHLSSCCRLKLEWFRKEEAQLMKRRESLKRKRSELPTNSTLKFQWDRNCCQAIRQRVWLLLENPGSSTAALIFTFLSIGFVLATVIILILSSMPEFQIFDQVANETLVIRPLDFADTACVIWFTCEHFLRLWACPGRLDYLKTPLCWIDMLAVLPFYVELLLSMVGIEGKIFGDLRRSLLLMRILRALRVMRVLRVLKVARYSKGFQSVGATVKKSWKELVMLVLFMFTTNVIFSTMMYFVESESNPDFNSIPASAWFCIITMTTVGYGDVYPYTVAGKFLAGIISITGIILLAFPISVIVEHFHQEYNDATRDVEMNESLRNEKEPVLLFNGMPMATKGHHRHKLRMFKL